MENDIIILKKDEKKKPSIAENLGKVGIEIGSKLGKVATEFFVGKPISKEEKELNAIRKERKFKLKLIQEDAQYQKDLELAEKGEYIPPTPKVVETKKNKGSIGEAFSNLGKNNPLDGFGLGNSSKQPDFGLGAGKKNSSNTPDFGLGGFMGTKNPIGNNKNKREVF